MANPAERVVVRPVMRADAAEMIAANRASVTYHAPWLTTIQTRQAFDAWFERTLTGALAGLLARERATGALVGAINLNEIVLGSLRSAYAGYYGYPATGGRGLMTEALIAAVRYAFDEFGLHRVEANIQPRNARSIALVRRAGFEKEGFSRRYLFVDGAWRDHERWAVIAD